MWKIALHIFLCLITGGLWLIPLSIYYLIKLFGGSIKFLDNWLPQKFTKNGTTKSFFFNPIQNYIDFEVHYKLSDYDETTKSFGTVTIHVSSKPKEVYNLFYDVVATIKIEISFFAPGYNNPIKNYFEITVYPNDNGICNDSETFPLSIKAKNIDYCNFSVVYSNGRVTIPPKANNETNKENKETEEINNDVIKNEDIDEKKPKDIEQKIESDVNSNVEVDANNSISFCDRIARETELIKQQTEAINKQTEALIRQQKIKNKAKNNNVKNSNKNITKKKKTVN